MLVKIVIALLMGAFSWTFMEYALHNWVGHLGKGKNTFSKEHLDHHANIMYFSPTKSKAVLATLTFVIANALTIPFVGLILGLTYSSGLVLFYTYYEFLHRRIHTHAPKNSYSSWARKHHFYHHFGNPNMNHGVTTPIWDIVFRTYVKVDQVRVPRTQRIDWLVDSETGLVKEEFSKDYMRKSPKNIAKEELAV